MFKKIPQKVHIPFPRVLVLEVLTVGWGAPLWLVVFGFEMPVVGDEWVGFPS